MCGCSWCLCVLLMVFLPGNLSWQASEDDLRAAFAECGEISNVRIAWDNEQDRSKGFGHVEFSQSHTAHTPQEARSTIAEATGATHMVIVCHSGSRVCIRLLDYAVAACEKRNSTLWLPIACITAPPLQLPACLLLTCIFALLCVLLSVQPPMLWMLP